MECIEGLSKLFFSMLFFAVAIASIILIGG